jgi:GNAT superfamily N-acetyltransferase
VNVDFITLERFDPQKNYYELKKFDCSHELINRFLKNSLKQNVKNNMSQSYVLLDTSHHDKLVGYYNVSSFSIAKERFETPPSGATRTIPALRLVMLGIDKGYAGCGLGSRLLSHCLHLTLRLSREAGIAGLYLDAENGKHDFYRRLGFVGIKAPEEGNILPMFITTATMESIR